MARSVRRLRGARLESGAVAHLSALLGALFIVGGLGYLLKAWNLLFSTSGAVFGAGYTDVHVRLPIIRVLMVVALALGAALVYNAVRARRPRWPLLAVGAWIAALIVLLGIVPAVFQSLFVNPNQLSRELPYIAYDLAATRSAYDLTAISEKSYPLTGEPDRDRLEGQPRDDRQHPPVGPGDAAAQLHPATAAAGPTTPSPPSASIATRSVATIARRCCRRASSTSPDCRPRPRPG